MLKNKSVFDVMYMTAEIAKFSGYKVGRFKYDCGGLDGSVELYYKSDFPDPFGLLPIFLTYQDFAWRCSFEALDYTRKDFAKLEEKFTGEKLTQFTHLLDKLNAELIKLEKKLSESDDKTHYRNDPRFDDAFLQIHECAKWYNDLNLIS